MKKLLLIFISIVLNANVLQDSIDKAAEHDTLKLSSGVYIGNIVINKAINIIADDKNVIIRGENKNSVISINSSNVKLFGLTIENSGQRPDLQDAAIKISKANNIEINSCTIKNSLYGIDASMLNKSKIINNKISSLNNLKNTLRGDAIRLFYSHNNLIENNTISEFRDNVFLYSNNNSFINNNLKNGRYGLFVDNSSNAIIKKNIFKHNSVSLMVISAKNTKVMHNSILSSYGAAGFGIVVKGVSAFIFKNNEVKYNSKAIYIDAKHNETKIERFIENNEISYNNEAFNFHGAFKQNQIINNIILGNIDDVVKGTKGNISSENIVLNNYWDQYKGFDKNNDNIGDNSFKVYQGVAQLWHYNPKLKYFYASPVLTLLDFISKIAPFVEPTLILEDKKPIVQLSKI